jgi:hypothetical protein
MARIATYRFHLTELEISIWDFSPKNNASKYQRDLSEKLYDRMFDALCDKVNSIESYKK